MKQKITFSFERETIAGFKRRMQELGYFNKSQFAESIIRKAIFSKEELIRQRMKELAIEINYLQDTLQIIED